MLNHRGRQVIYTDELNIDSSNIIPVLQESMKEFRLIAEDIDYLLQYDLGHQPIQRIKSVRPDINFQGCDNVVNEVCEFKKGYHWGNPITLVQAGGDNTLTDSIEALNRCYRAENLGIKTQQLAEYVEKCGVCYTFIDVKVKNWADGDSYFTYEVLNPKYSFVVRTRRSIDHKIVLAVTYSATKSGDVYFTCFTDSRRYEIKCSNNEFDGGTWQFIEGNDSLNPLGVIPFVEWIRNVDRTGCFEREISECDRLNLLISDLANQVDQETQTIWHTNDVDFPTEIITDENGKEIEVEKTPKSNEWVQTYTHPDGKTPFIKPLTCQYDYNGILSNILATRQLILERCHVPSRSETSGGSSGIAMSDASGWSDAEMTASSQQQIMESCKIEEIKIVIRAVKLHPKSNDCLGKLVYSDIQANIKRQKTFELTTKANAAATLINVGYSGLHVTKAINLFDDANEVWKASKDNIEKHQEQMFTVSTPSVEETAAQNKIEVNKDRNDQDESDQVDRSPRLDKHRD